MTDPDRDRVYTLAELDELDPAAADAVRRARGWPARHRADPSPDERPPDGPSPDGPPARRPSPAPRPREAPTPTPDRKSVV